MSLPDKDQPFIPAFRNHSVMKILFYYFLLIAGLSVTTDALTVDLPAPLEWAAPTAAPAVAGDSFDVTFNSEPISPLAPVISEWNRSDVKPDESFTLSGIRFTSRTGDAAHTDTLVWLYASTPAGGTLRSCRVWSAEDSLLTAAIPANVPFGQYVVWVENEAGPSAPICLNRPNATWIGPINNQASAGTEKRIFGQGLSKDHGLLESHVFLQPAGGGEFVEASVTSVEPYMVKFVVPSTLSDGVYQVYLHRGHGGIYGWTTPLSLTVGPAVFVRGSAQVTVAPSGGDDSPALQSAIDAMAANSTGGTVQLAAGTYTLGSTLRVGSGVRLLGAGKESTIMQINLTGTGLERGGFDVEDYVSLEDFTARQVNVDYNARLIRAFYKTGFVLRNVRVDGDENQTDGTPQLLVTGGELSGCDFYRGIFTAGAVGLWIYDCRFYGSLHGGAEAGIFTIYQNYRVIVENCSFETPAWPTGSDGSRNYKNFLTPEDYNKLNFCIRAYSGGGSLMYFGHNTAQDVAPGNDDLNKGEMILFHALATAQFAQIASSSATTSTIRTDGLINGQTAQLGGNGGVTLNPFQTVPEGGWDVTIIAGTGRGQSRRIVSSTATTFTVDQPWRVPPSSDSVVSLCVLFRDNVVYANELNAFPSGYILDYSASTGISLDGNCWNNTIEGNTSRRTFGGRSILGVQSAPGYWNTARDESALELYAGGIYVAETKFSGDSNVGAATLGNAVRGGTLSFQTSRQPEVTFTQVGAGVYESGLGGGNVIERLNSAGSQIGLTVSAQTNALFRLNTFTLAQDPGTSGAKIGGSLGSPSRAMLAGNNYIGQDIVYGGSRGSTLQPLERVVLLSAFSDESLTSGLIDLANLGTAPGSLRVVGTSLSGFSASITPSLSLAAEQTNRQLTVSADLSVGELPYGITLGTVTLASPLRLSVITNEPIPLVDTQPGELGMRFRPTQNGKITKLRYYREARDLYPHTGRLWSSDGTKLAEIVYPAQAKEGWQEVTLTSPISVLSGQDYIVSDDNEFWTVSKPSGFTSPINNQSISGLSGVIKSGYNGRGQFPETATTTNYFRDVVFEPDNAEITQVVGVRIEITETIFDAWKRGFSIPRSTPPTLDTDGDGVSLLLEYALGGNPNVNSLAILPEVKKASATDKLQLTFLRSQGDLTYTVEATNELADPIVWTTLAQNPGAVGQTITILDFVSLTEQPRRFLRLRISRP